MHRQADRKARTLTLLLLLLNALTLAAGLALEHWRAQPRAIIGYNADKVRLLAHPQPAVKDSPVAPGATEVKPEAQTVAAQPVCLQVTLGGITAYDGLRAAMREAGLGALDLRAEARLGWWVYWPPLDDPVKQVQALAAINAAGVRDFAPIRQGPMARAISLGMFKSEADARAQHAALTRKGLTELRYGPRPGIRVIYLDIPAELSGRLDVLRAAVPSGVALETRSCAG